MHQIIVQHGTDASPEEVAAVLAAVSLALEEEAQAAAGVTETDAAAPGWRAAARLTTQGLTPWRAPTTVQWNTIERIRRAGRGAGGIVGM